MMIAQTPSDLRHYLGTIKQERIALVPTMGCLHAGHISLIRKAKRLADIVVVSIYVNPLQFGENEDFGQYPRVFEDDAAICKAEGVDCIFHPHNLYADDGAKITLQVHDLDKPLCGASRMGHFDGVVTVVNILFNVVQPNIAVFGEKDWQQLAIIHRMVSDLHMPIGIVGSEIIREDDGLAMSSRNRYLDKQERALAPKLYNTLQSMQSFASQTHHIEDILQHGLAQLEAHPIAVEYLDIRDERSLQSMSRMDENIQPRIFIAAKIGNTRLLDNAPLFPQNLTEKDML